MRKAIAAAVVIACACWVAVVVAANNPYGIIKGINGQWPIIQCGSGATPQSCTEHWVIGSGSQDPPNGFGADGDLFWRTDLLSFRARTAGVWGALSFGLSSFPLLAPDGAAGAGSYSFANYHGTGIYTSGGQLNLEAGPNQRFQMDTSGVFYFRGTTGQNLHIQSGVGEVGGIWIGPVGAEDTGITRVTTSVLRVGLNAAAAVTNTLQGPDSAGANNVGGGLTIKGGGATAGNANGGDLTLSGGAPIGSGIVGQVTLVARTFANLGTPANGALAFCSDCTIANPCASGGSGALAKRLNGVWVCN